MDGNECGMRLIVDFIRSIDLDLGGEIVLNEMGILNERECRIVRGPCDRAMDGRAVLLPQCDCDSYCLRCAVCSSLALLSCLLLVHCDHVHVCFDSTSAIQLMTLYMHISAVYTVT